MSTTQRVHEYETKFARRRLPTDKGILYLEFPLHAYWRHASSIPELRVKNVEGLIHPSFTIITFAEKYKVEQVEPTKFKVHHAVGYVPCVLCGKVIRSELANVEVDVEKPIERFYPEVAYELVLATLAKSLSPKVKSHIVHTHSHPFTVEGRERVVIMRNIGAEELVMESYITSYRCQKDGEKVVGVLGMLDHVVSKHEGVDTAKKVVEFVGRVTDTTQKLLSLGKENIPILGAFRNTFSYVLVEDTGKPKSHSKLLVLEYFSRWLVMKVVEREGRVDLIASTTIPRALRGIYHHPLFRYAVVEMAYKMNPKKYNWFIVETKRALQRNGYPLERLRAIDSMITGTLSYTPIEPKHAFSVSLDVLESVRSKLEEKAVDLKVFLSHRVV